VREKRSAMCDDALLTGETVALMPAQDDARLIAKAKLRFFREYAARWQRMLATWRHPPRAMMGWLMYASNYLFTTHGVRWALDPVIPTSRLLPNLPGELPMEALADLSFLLLTHNHAGHVDYRLLAALRSSGVRLVVPEHMLATVRAYANPHDKQVIVAQHGQRLDLNGIGVLPVSGWHWQRQADGQLCGLDATAYLVEVDGQRWLFPGDVRDYGVPEIRQLGPVDLLFAHLWLGRGCAGYSVPPLLDAFCDYLRGCAPRAVVLTHLYEFSRATDDLWHQRHVALVRSRWAALAPNVPLRAPEVGEKMVL